MERVAARPAPSVESPTRQTALLPSRSRRPRAAPALAKAIRTEKVEGLHPLAARSTPEHPARAEPVEIWQGVEQLKAELALKYGRARGIATRAARDLLLRRLASTAKVKARYRLRRATVKQRRGEMRREARWRPIRRDASLRRFAPTGGERLERARRSGVAIEAVVRDCRHRRFGSSRILLRSRWRRSRAFPARLWVACAKVAAEFSWP